jgi:Domain of unknown function (DUF4389)
MDVPDYRASSSLTRDQSAVDRQRWSEVEARLAGDGFVVAVVVAIDLGTHSHVVDVCADGSNVDGPPVMAVVIRFQRVAQPIFDTDTPVLAHALKVGIRQTGATSGRGVSTAFRPYRRDRARRTVEVAKPQRREFEMRTGRVIALVVGCLLLLPGIGLLVGGGALSVAYAVGRDDDGYFDVTIDRLQSQTVAVTTEDLQFTADPGSPDWVLDALDADIRLRVTNSDAGRDVFVGIARSDDLDEYLSGVAHDEIAEVEGTDPLYRSRTGGSVIAPPTEESFWVAEASGAGTQELTWEATSGQWSAVVMNADGSPEVSADVNVGSRMAFLLPLGLTMLGIGVLLTIAAVVLITVGAIGARRSAPAAADAEPGTLAEQHGRAVASPAADNNPPYPLALSADLDPGLSRWLWLVKWFLAIPHFVVLAFLWVGFVVLTVVAGVAILITGRYPRRIFDFNVGVLRWSWRVSYYATSGGLGSDEYPPFSLVPEPGDSARLTVTYPVHLSRWMVLVKWFLAIPHLLVVGLLAGWSVGWFATSGDRVRFDPAGGGGLLGLLVLAAGVVLLFTGRYPRALFDLIIGFNRWVYRVVAYVALMTDEYPPFRLDQGGTEPTGPVMPLLPPPGPLSAPDVATKSPTPLPQDDEVLV